MKAHFTDRYRGGIQYVEKWTNAKAGLIGYYTGLGRTSAQIADVLHDGTSEHTIRRMWAKWGLPLEFTGGRSVAPVPVRLDANIRGRLGRIAIEQHLAPEEWLRRVALASIRDDLYAAIVGDSN